MRWALLAFVLTRAAGASESFDAAVDSLFALQSASVGASQHAAAARALAALLERHEIPASAAALRNLTDVQLTQVGLLAAIGKLSSWQRDSAGRLLLDQQGGLLHQYSPAAVESDVMLCLVCTLLAVIVMFHVVPPRPG